MYCIILVDELNNKNTIKFLYVHCTVLMWICIYYGLMYMCVFIVQVVSRLIQLLGERIIGSYNRVSTPTSSVDMGTVKYDSVLYCIL